MIEKLIFKTDTQDNIDKLFDFFRSENWYVTINEGDTSNDDEKIEFSLTFQYRNNYYKYGLLVTTTYTYVDNKVRFATVPFLENIDVLNENGETDLRFFTAGEQEKAFGLHIDYYEFFDFDFIENECSKRMVEEKISASLGIQKTPLRG